MLTVDSFNFKELLLFPLKNNNKTSVTGAVEGGTDHNTAYWEQPFSQPYFDNTTKREVTTTVGQTARLHCRVRNLGDRAVCIIQLCLTKFAVI